MKCISLWQPWASLIGRGKSIETRSWALSYRGPIAIHAAKRFTGEEVDLCNEEPFRTCLQDFAQHTPDGVFTRFKLPLGAVVAVVRLTECLPTSRAGWAVFDGPPFIKGSLIINHIERKFGDYSPGRYAWLLSDIRILPEPIPFKGSQGFFEVPDDLLREAKP